MSDIKSEITDEENMMATMLTAAAADRAHGTALHAQPPPANGCGHAVDVQDRAHELEQLWRPWYRAYAAVVSRTRSRLHCRRGHQPMQGKRPTSPFTDECLVRQTDMLNQCQLPDSRPLGL